MSKLDLFSFVPFRLNRLAAEVSAELSGEYRDRYGLDIPEWRVMATLGFRDEACTAQYIAYCTRTHKSCSRTRSTGFTGHLFGLALCIDFDFTFFFSLPAKKM